jgi:signal transduction histidine kinase
MSRWSLRTRTSALFALGALGVSGAVATGTYEVTRRSLLAERERTAVRAAYFDAAVVRQGVVGGGDVVDVLRSLDTGQGRRPLIFLNGRWYARTADTGFTSAVPASLRRLVQDGRPGVQRVRLNGTPTLVVGVPVASVNVNYYELTTQTEPQRTLQALAVTLAVVAVITAAGAAVLGQWASRRLLRPLSSVAGAARSIAAGDLDARLESSGDPDLIPLTSSFNDMVSELVARIERDRRFAADVSHELRSPLQTLTAASDVLTNRRHQLDDRTAAAVDLIVAEVERFSVLVTDLLELARADREIELRPVNVAAILHRTCSTHGVTLDVVSVAEDLVWDLDERRFERIVANLLDNGQRHGGGVSAVRCDLSDTGLRLVVEDDGPGVPLEERAMIFYRFGRGRRASARGGSGGTAVDGTGLGLSLVAEHVASHGGAVSVTASAGGGARFEVLLPTNAR